MIATKRDLVDFEAVATYFSYSITTGDDVMVKEVVRIVGKRREPIPRVGEPSLDVQAWTKDMAKGIEYHHPKGVFRFKTHEDAERNMTEVVTDAMARRHLELAKRRS